jgi:hypothetical protein
MNQTSKFVRIKEAHKLIEEAESNLLKNINKIISKTKSSEGATLFKRLDSLKPTKSNINIGINMLLDNLPEDKAPAQEILDAILSKCEKLFDLVKSENEALDNESIDKLALFMALGFACSNLFAGDAKDVEKRYQFMAKQIPNLFDSEEDAEKVLDIIVGKQITDLTLSAAAVLGKTETVFTAIPALIHAAFSIYAAQYSMIEGMAITSEPIETEESRVIEAKPLKWINLSSPITMDDVLFVEKETGLMLPEDYVVCVLQHNGGTPIPSGLPDIETEIDHLHSLNKEDEDFVLIYYRLFEKESNGLLFPFGSDGCGNYFCFLYKNKKDKNPTVVFYDHEVQRITFLALTFSDLLNSLEPIETEESRVIEAKPSTVNALKQLDSILKKTQSPEADSLVNQINSLPPTEDSIEIAFQMLVDILPEDQKPAETILNTILSYAKMLYTFILTEAKKNPVYANDKRLNKFAFNIAIGFISSNLLVKNLSKIDKHYNSLKKRIPTLFQSTKKTALSVVKNFFAAVTANVLFSLGVTLGQPLVVKASIPVLIYAQIQFFKALWNILIDIFVGRDVFKGTQAEENKK